MTRIAVASDDGQLIAAHTGRCGCLVIFDVVDGTVQRVEVRQNTFTAHARGECAGEHAGEHAHARHSHDGLIGAVSDCCALVTRGLGPRLVMDLSRNGVDAYVTTATEVEAAAAAFAAGELPRADQGTCCPGH